MNTPSSPSLLTPTRLVKHKDKLVSIPVSSQKTVDNIFINDLQGFDLIVTSIIEEKQKSGMASAMKLLEHYQFLYKLSDQEFQNFAYLTGIVAPYDSNKLSTIEADIYKIIFPKFTRQYEDFIELTTENWIDWKISILKDYIINGVNDSNHKFLDSIKKKGKKEFKAVIDTLINSTSFDESVKFNPFIGFNIDKNMDGLVIIDDKMKIKILDKEKEYLPIGHTYAKPSPASSTSLSPVEGIVRLKKHLASLLFFVDSVLNKCILKYMNENGMSYLDEYKPTSFSDGSSSISKPSYSDSSKKTSSSISNASKKPSSSINDASKKTNSSISDASKKPSSSINDVSKKTSTSDGSKKKKLKKSVKKSPMKKSRKNKIKNNIIINNVTTK